MSLRDRDAMRQAVAILKDACDCGYPRDTPDYCGVCLGRVTLENALGVKRPKRTEASAIKLVPGVMGQALGQGKTYRPTNEGERDE